MGKYIVAMELVSRVYVEVEAYSEDVVTAAWERLTQHFDDYADQAQWGEWEGEVVERPDEEEEDDDDDDPTD